MKKKKRTAFLISILLILSLTLSSCVTGGSDTPSASEASSRDAFENFLAQEFQESFEEDLLTLHYTLKDPEAYGIEKPEKAFPSITDDYNETCRQELQDTQKTLSQINKAHLSQEQQITYETLEKYLEQQMALCDYPQFIHVLGANSGISTNLPLTLAEYAFYSEDDVKDYLSILPQVTGLFEEAYVWEKKQAQNGYGLSDFEITDTIKQIDTFLNSRDENLLIATFNDRIDALSDLQKDQKATYKSNNKNLVTTIVLPAFETLRGNLLELQKSAPQGEGLAHYKDGKDYYELLIQSMTFSDRSISTLIKTMEKRMKTITRQITRVTLADEEVYDIFCSTEDFTDETPQQMLDRLKKCMKQDYPELEDISYKVEPIPDALKNNTTAAYYMIPPLDSAEENRIYYGDHAESSAALFMTLAHEGYPGHLYHQNYMLKDGLNPVFYVMNITGYKEAWAYYVEMNATDYCDFGDYDEEYHDTLSLLYQYNDEFSYCISSLIDLYVNYKGYDEADIENVITKYGLDSTSAKALYEFAVEEPGAYLQYYVGYLELLSIRQDAEKKLEDGFNEKSFHTEILETGPCYFSQLARVMKAWTKSQK